MASIVERVKALQLPLDHLVVIGSGLLDAYNLREASDIDLALSNDLYDQLKNSGVYTEQEIHGDVVLLRGDVEAWHGWFEQSFAHLAQDAVFVDGVAFANPRVIIAAKQTRGSEKDLKDITLLQEYLHDRN